MQRVDITTSYSREGKQAGSIDVRRDRINAQQKRLVRYIAAGLCLLSELIHLWLLPGEYETFIGYGIIFLLIAMLQGIVGINLLFEPHRRVMTLGIWCDALIALLYIFTHTIGVLVGLAFLPFPIDMLGSIATIAELVVVGVLIFLRRDFKRVKKPKVVKVSNKK